MSKACAIFGLVILRRGKRQQCKHLLQKCLALETDAHKPIFRGWPNAALGGLYGAWSLLSPGPIPERTTESYGGMRIAL